MAEALWFRAFPSSRLQEVVPGSLCSARVHLVAAGKSAQALSCLCSCIEDCCWCEEEERRPCVLVELETAKLVCAGVAYTCRRRIEEGQAWNLLSPTSTPGTGPYSSHHTTTLSSPYRRPFLSPLPSPPSFLVSDVCLAALEQVVLSNLYH